MFVNAFSHWMNARITINIHLHTNTERQHKMFFKYIVNTYALWYCGNHPHSPLCNITVCTNVWSDDYSVSLSCFLQSTVISKRFVYQPDWMGIRYSLFEIHICSYTGKQSDKWTAFIVLHSISIFIEYRRIAVAVVVVVVGCCCWFGCLFSVDCLFSSLHHR